MMTNLVEQESAVQIEYNQLCIKVKTKEHIEQAKANGALNLNFLTLYRKATLMGKKIWKRWWMAPRCGAFQKCYALDPLGEDQTLVLNHISTLTDESRYVLECKRTLCALMIKTFHHQWDDTDFLIIRVLRKNVCGKVLDRSSGVFRFQYSSLVLLRLTINNHSQIKKKTSLVSGFFEFVS